MFRVCKKNKASNLIVLVHFCISKNFYLVLSTMWFHLSNCDTEQTITGTRDLNKTRTKVNHKIISKSFKMLSF